MLSELNLKFILLKTLASSLLLASIGCKSSESNSIENDSLSQIQQLPLDCYCKVIVNKNKTLNIRNLPSADSPFLDTLLPGELVKASCTPQSGFRLINDSKRTQKTGYSTDRFLKCTPIPEASALGYDILWADPLPQLDINNKKINLSRADFANLIYVAKFVLPLLKGTYEEKIERASNALWWSLKEGVFGHQESWIYRYSNCTTQNAVDVVDYNQAARNCPRITRNPPWQVGLGAVQVYNQPWTKVEEVFKSYYGEKEPKAHIRELLNLARYDGIDIEMTTDQIIANPPLLQSWMLRDPLISVEFAHIEVKNECLQAGNIRAWCYRSTQAFAPDAPSIKPIIGQLAGLLKKYYRNQSP